MQVRAEPLAHRAITGVYFCIALSAKVYAQGNVQLINSVTLPLAQTEPTGQNEYLRAFAKGVRLAAERQQVEISLTEPTEIIVKKNTESGDILVYIPILSGNATPGQAAEKTIALKASGTIDTRPAHLTLYPSQTGRPFDGLGGNFRIQNPKNDPQVIEYSLENLRVAWGRVELPWRQWHPEETTDPLEAARQGTVDPKVTAALEMANTLDSLGIPVILAAWFPPAWAVEGPLTSGRQADGSFGNALDSTKMEQIYASIGAYVVFLQEEYGVETVMFSFNESDLGIDVRQTAQQHTALIKGLGAWFAARGLKTKLLLGDTADANGYAFIDDAMADPAARPYIGAVSFHSWRGWATPTLNQWRAAAARLDLPLIVGEGSIDAGAWRYPAIFEEPTYAREEINLYVRLLAICQPLTILQWQLTADYSPLAGGGIFGNDEALHPTQRFWNLKQLAYTPKGLLAMPITSDHPSITCAALGDNEQGAYTIHLVNNGTAREVTINGVPTSAKSFKIYTTNQKKAMESGKPIRVSNGQVTFILPATSYVTLMSGQ